MAIIARTNRAVKAPPAPGSLLCRPPKSDGISAVPMAIAIRPGLPAQVEGLRQPSALGPEIQREPGVWNGPAGGQCRWISPNNLRKPARPCLSPHEMI
jgi:hypothetical protein